MTAHQQQNSVACHEPKWHEHNCVALMRNFIPHIVGIGKVGRYKSQNGREEKDLVLDV